MSSGKSATMTVKTDGKENAVKSRNAYKKITIANF